MFRRPITLVFVFLSLLGFTVAGVLAQGSPPPPDATPGAVGVTGALLGNVDPVAAPGYRLVMAETVLEPGAYINRHTHPTAIVVCVQSGALGFAAQQGAPTVTRGGTGAEPATTEVLDPNVEIVLEPRDCVSFDEFATHTIHTAWNASDETTVLWEARLVKIGEPFTTFVDEQGTPVATPLP